MAANIFHGAPGSYKSASAVWCELLPALRAGRLVVTNIEGIADKTDIEIALNEEFPEGAEIWRISSQTDVGKYLWMRWFWWMPCGAFIILDEVQDVFPADTTVFKPIELDSLGIDAIKDKLPEFVYKKYYQVIEDFTPDDAYQDDTGQDVLDQNSHIIYPKTMREANMRHRKYNWDIIYCTPDITQIHKLVRGVCQYAYKHKYFDSLEFIPYFVRRPRITEHSPTTNGQTTTKDTQNKWRKIDERVFKLYRSTSTGGVTKRRGVNLFASFGVLFPVALLLLCFGYIFYWLFNEDEPETVLEVEQASPQVSRQAKPKTNIVPDTFNNNSTAFKTDVSLELPFGADNIYFNGYQTVHTQKGKYNEYFFTLRIGEDEASINSYDLKNFGYRISLVNDCIARIKKGDSYRLVTCSPKISEPYVPEPELQPKLQLTNI